MTAHPEATEAEARRIIREFAAARDWAQFHSPKNLSMALAGEVGELVSVFQWLTEAESDEAMTNASLAAEIRSEMADVTVYLTLLADRLGVDLWSAVAEKMARNEKRFPADQIRGRYQLP